MRAGHRMTKPSGVAAKSIILVFTSILISTNCEYLESLGPSNGENRRVGDIIIQPGSVTLDLGDTTSLQAIVTDVEGNTIAEPNVAWSTSDERVAVVDRNGVVTGVASGWATIMATSEDESATAIVTVTAGTDLTGSLIVEPASSQIVIGGSVALRAILIDDFGQRTQIENAAWASSDSSIAAVDASGNVIGVSAGSAEVTASFSGKSATATIDVQQRASGVWMEKTLEAYNTTEELRSDCAGWYDCLEDLGLDRVFLDTVVSYSAGGLTRSMRYDWVDQGCSSVSRGRGIRLPEDVREVWVEVVIRWSVNYTAANSACPPPAHKLVFGQVVPDGNFRWALLWHATGGNQVLESPRNPAGQSVQEVTNESSTQYHDEQWHVLRMHWRHSTNESTNDAAFRFWIDGKLVHTMDGFATKAGMAIRAILLGRNKDKGQNSGLESLWIGRVRAWKENPGW